MANKYVLDACAITAFLNDEVGADIVQTHLENADKGDIIVYMNKLNLFEVYYNIMRVDGEENAEDFYRMMLQLPIEIINGISDDVLREAGRIKAKYKMSLADSIALGEASVLGASILTSDHHEFDIVEKNTNIRFTWIR